MIGPAITTWHTNARLEKDLTSLAETSLFSGSQDMSENWVISFGGVSGTETEESPFPEVVVAPYQLIDRYFSVVWGKNLCVGRFRRGWVRDTMDWWLEWSGGWRESWTLVCGSGKDAKTTWLYRRKMPGRGRAGDRATCAWESICMVESSAPDGFDVKYVQLQTLADKSLSTSPRGKLLLWRKTLTHVYVPRDLCHGKISSKRE